MSAYFGKKIKEIRKKNNLTQLEFAQIFGYKDKSMIAHIEKGETEMSNDKIALLIEKFNIDANELFQVEKNEEKVILSNQIDTQIAIKFLKDTFEKELANNLNLIRVSAPLFVEKKSGLNDDLSGKEERVHFQIKDEEIEIVQSLAKWKRYALKEYNFPKEVGLYTDMNAIRKDEVMDNLHSIYVDQWDW